VWKPFSEKALREVLLNAVLHSDYGGAEGAQPTLTVNVYKDRLHVTNTCHAGSKRFANFFVSPPHRNLLLNKRLATALNKLHLVEAVGSGLARVYTESVRYGKREPTVKFTQGDGVSLRSTWDLCLFDGEGSLQVRAFATSLQEKEGLASASPEFRFQLALLAWARAGRDLKKTLQIIGNPNLGALVHEALAKPFCAVQTNSAGILELKPNFRELL
jgi:hypothetical protein